MSALKNPNALQYEFIQNTLIFSGSMTLKAVDSVIHDVCDKLDDYTSDTLLVDLEKVSEMDSSGVVFLDHIKNQMLEKNIRVELINQSDAIQKILQTFKVPAKDKRLLKRKQNVFESLGQTVYEFVTVSLHEFIYLTADLFYWTFMDLFEKKSHRKGEFVNQAVNIGVNAVPIVGLLSFMIGLVLALQSAAQLRQFGANIFIVDLVVIALTAEMGPLLTAVVIAGRSGSAIASEIATMTVTEEVDALKSMGLNPLRYIVVPKMHASIFSLPFLTIFANILGIIGGMVIASIYLDVSFPVFYNRMSQVLLFRDLLTGFVKSLVFAGLIVETGAFFGFRVTGGSEGVGKSTTKAVVVAISLVIIADSIMGLMFY